MTLNEYQDNARRTRLASADKEYARYNIAGEVGELLSLYAKSRRDGDDHTDKIAKELGDVLWHVAAIADDHGWTLGYIAQLNLMKLAARSASGTLTGSGDDR
jgi:NTP pyrophosphatase (non-canonical NTP hydrolase)